MTHTKERAKERDRENKRERERGMGIGKSRQCPMFIVLFYSSIWTSFDSEPSFISVGGEVMTADLTRSC